MGTGPFFARHRRVAFIAAAATLSVAATVVSAATPDELRQERKEVQAQAADLASEIDAANAEVEDLEAALAAAQANVDAQRAAVEAANRTLAEAEATQARAETAIIDLEAQQEQARLDLQAAVVDNYVSFQGFDDLDILGDDPWAATREQTLAEFATGTGFEGLDDLRAIGAELEFQRELAAQATQQAEQSRVDMEMRLAELDTALLLEADLLSQAVDRQERRLGEAAALAELEADLSEQIRVEEQRIADAIADRLPPGGGSVQIPPGADVDLVVVGGITVNVLVEDQVRGILAAMSARGFNLGGGGYRSIESQIRLRRANCGTSDYAVWEMPASQCRPPTARPGLSQHELGLAIDFTVNGRVIRSRDTDVFRALSEVAPEFGFFNLPSEPWHWSTTGG
ncbi:MAG: D-alanyl-D-alanine carboxypeptidase family protein [Actinomycetota bacterium]